MAKIQKFKESPLNPGSDEALVEGCRCSVLDNAHGKGYFGGVVDEQGRPSFVISWICPLHGVEEVEENEGI